MNRWRATLARATALLRRTRRVLDRADRDGRPAGASLAAMYNARCAACRTDLEWFGAGQELRLISTREAARLRPLAPTIATTTD